MSKGLPSEKGEKVAYGFGGRLSPDFPSQILMDITEVCNLACIHCPHPQFKKSGHYGARYLSPDLNEKMVDEVRNHSRGKAIYIRYASNGEPLIHPHGYEMIEHAARDSGVYVTLTTNGTIMNEKRTARLLEAGVHMIDISIDAYREETYSRVRVNGDLSITRENVLRLIRWVDESKADTKVVVSFVEQPVNRSEVEDFRAYWTDQGVDFVVIRRMHSCSGAKRTQVNDQGERPLERYPCLYPWERICINARGDLAFCPSDWVHGSYVADYRETSIREQWQGEFYRNLRIAHLRSRFDDFPFCGQCPDWSVTRWPGSGRSYADMIEEFISHEKRDDE